MKFKAPLHVTGIFACGHEVRADENGVAELPEGAHGAHGALADAMKVAGWEVIADDEQPAEQPVAGKPPSKPATLPAAPSGDAE